MLAKGLEDIRHVGGLRSDLYVASCGSASECMEERMREQELVQVDSGSEDGDMRVEVIQTS